MKFRIGKYTIIFDFAGEFTGGSDGVPATSSRPLSKGMQLICNVFVFLLLAHLAVTIVELIVMLPRIIEAEQYVESL